MHLENLSKPNADHKENTFSLNLVDILKNDGHDTHAVKNAVVSDKAAESKVADQKPDPLANHTTIDNIKSAVSGISQGFISPYIAASDIANLGSPKEQIVKWKASHGDLANPYFFMGEYAGMGLNAGAAAVALGLMRVPRGLVSSVIGWSVAGADVYEGSKMFGNLGDFRKGAK